MNLIVEQINSTGQVFVNFAIPMLVQSSLLILILLFVDLLLRKKIRAGFRYWIWTLVLVKLALPTSLSTPVSLGHWFGEELVMMDVGQIISSPSATEINTDRRVPLTPGVEPPLPVTGPVISPDVSEVQITWKGIVFVSWLVVVMVMMLMLLQRTLFVRGLVTQAQKANGSLNDTLAQCCNSMGIRRNIGLRISTNMTSPAVCRLFRPVILLPHKLLPSLDVSQLRAILMHELAHLKRFDLWVNFGQTFLQIVYFYNPLLWLANAIIRRAREQAVDEAVLVAMGEKAQEYLETLVNVAKLAFRGPTLSLRLIGVVESKNLFEWRIRTMLSRPIPKSAKLGVLGTIVILFIAAILLPMAKAEKSGERSISSTSENQAKPEYSLHEAAAKGDIEQIKSLLSKGADVNAKDDRGMTPLHEAAYYGQKEVAKLLIAKGANVSSKDTSGQTPLHKAVTFGSILVSELLVAGGADVNVRDDRGNTPLHTARVKIESIEFLLAKGADVNARNNRGDTPLHVVARFPRSFAAADYLLAHGANVNAKDNRGDTPLHNAAYINQKDLVELLVAKGAMIDEKANNGSTPLHAAAEGGSYDVVAFFLDKGADINSAQSNGRTALHHASGAGHDAVAELLISRGANVNTESNDGETPLDAAALVGAVKLCALLIEKRAKVDSLCSAVATGDLTKVESFINQNTPPKEKDSALCAAAAFGREDMAELLISKGTHASAKNRREETALHLAAKGGYSGVAKLLITNGADVNATARNGKTPLHYAAERGDKDMVLILLDTGANVNAGPERRGRAVYYASRNGHGAVARLLIDRGADLPSVDLFFSAVCKDQKDLVEYLIKKGADVDLEDKDSWVHPPSLYALWEGSMDTLALLLDHGANVDAQDKSGWSLLHYSAGSPALTKLLLERGANPNVMEKERGQTPLHIAAKGFREDGDGEPKDYPASVQLLIAHGANVNAKDWDGKTSLVLAKEKGRTEIVELLLKYGAKE